MTLLDTVLEPLFQGEKQIPDRNRMARVLLDSANNIIFRLDMDKNFTWEEFMDDLLKLLLQKSDEKKSTYDQNSFPVTIFNK